MPEMPDLKRKYGFQLTPEQMLYMQQTQPRSGGQIATDIIRQSSPELAPEPNILQRMSSGAGKAADLVNKYAPKIYDNIPKKVTSLAPFGFLGLNQGFQDLLSQSRKDVSNTEVPTSLKMIPSIDTTTGEMQPAGFGEGRASIGKIASSIKPADLLGLTSAQKVYSDLGYGQAPEPMDVLDTLGLHTGMLQAGKAGFRGASSVAKASAPYVAEGLTDLVSKYGVDPRMNIIPDSVSAADAVPEGFKLGQENGKFVVFDASGKIFANGNDAKSAIFRANKRLENESANAARTARREAIAAETPPVEEKPQIKVDTDPESSTFYNPLYKAAVNLDEKTNAMEMLNDLKSYENVSKDQLEFSGVEDYLTAKAENNIPVTKDEIVNFVENNRVQLKEYINQDSEASLGDLEINDRNLEASEPDDYHLQDQKDYYEQQMRDDGEADEIYQQVREQNPDLNEDEIKDIAEETISSRASASALDSYYDNPEYNGSNSLGYTVSGNSDYGWYIQDPDGRNLTRDREVYSIDEVNEIIKEDAIQNGLLSDTPAQYGPKTHPEYVMPGGTNYREVNIALEPQSINKISGTTQFVQDQVRALDMQAREIRSRYPAIIDRPPEIQKQVEDLDYRRMSLESDVRYYKEQERALDSFSDSHFDEENIITQLRLQDFNDVDGKSGVLGDELQSDWHQQGRNKGYKGSPDDVKRSQARVSQANEAFQNFASQIPELRGFSSFNLLKTAIRRGNFEDTIKANIDSVNETFPNEQIPPFEMTPELQAKLDNLKELYQETVKADEENRKLFSAVPDAPFKKDWYQIGLRRLIKEAIESGKDRVYIPSGEAVADRYNYASAIDKIAYKANDDGTYSLNFKPIGQETYTDRIGNQSFANMQPEDIDAVVGKDMADKIRSGFRSSSNKSFDFKDVNVIDNADIEVGGKGFKKYYDEVYPNFLKKEAAEFGATTGYTEIKAPTTNKRQQEKLIKARARKNKISTKEMENRIYNDQKSDFFRENKEPVFYLEINDAMRQAYGKGRPYARGGLVTDALDSVDDHFENAQKFKEGGKAESAKEKGADDVPQVPLLSTLTNTKQEFRAVEPEPIMGSIASGLNKASEFLKSRPMKETDDMSSAINTALELADSFFVNDLAKTAERISYGDRLTSGKGQTLKVLPETLGAVTTVLPVVTKLAKPVAKAVTKLAPEVGETAAQMAERYAIQPSYVVPPTKGKRMTREEAEAAGLWHPISDVKLVRPYDEMTSVTVDNPAVKMAPRKILTSDDLLGKTGIQLVGDRAATGKILNEINGVKLEWPVPLTGGGKYSMANLSKDPNKSAAWESGKGVVTKLQDQIDMAAKESDDVLGIFSTGSLQQVDFNSMMSSALAAQLKGAKISKNAAKEFDEEMVKFVPKFAGIKSSKLKDQIFDKSNGVLRTKFVELMEQERFQKMGFPSVPATRKAITDLEYLDVPLGTTGLVINKMDKGRRIVTPDNPSDYPLAMGGEYVGEIVGGLPYQTMFSTLNKQRRLLGANPAGDYRSYTQSKGFQKFDNEWQDTVEKYLEQRRKLTGKAKGGAVEGFKVTDEYTIAPEAKTGKWSQRDEKAFQKGVRGTKWYKQFADKYGEPPDLNSKDYNYRAAWKAGVRPQDYEHDAEMQHWASTTGRGESLKAKNHPSAWMEDYMQITGSDPHEPVELTPEQVGAMERSLKYRYGK